MIGRASLEMMQDIYHRCYFTKTAKNSKANSMEENSTTKVEVSNLSLKKCKKNERTIKLKKKKLVPKDDKIEDTGNTDSVEASIKFDGNLFKYI